MSKKIILACMCVLALGACKKDCQKLATEFERALPDTVEVLAEQINEIDHFVYYKNKSNTELIRYDLETKKSKDIKPELEDGESIYGIYMGKENIAFLKHDNSENGSTFSMLLTYNLKTQKFKEIESFYGAEPIDAFADEKDRTITGYIWMKMAPTVKYVYDFDGNKISEEAEPVEEFNPDDMLEDLSIESDYQHQVEEKPLQEYRCRKCGQRVAARNEIEAGIKARYGCEPAGSSHSWDYIQF